MSTYIVQVPHVKKESEERTATFNRRIPREESEWTIEKPKAPGMYWGCIPPNPRVTINGKVEPRVLLTRVIELNDYLVVGLGERTVRSLNEYSHWIGPFVKVPAQPDPPDFVAWIVE